MERVGLEEIDMGKSQETSVCARKRAGSGAAMRLSSTTRSYKLRRSVHIMYVLYPLCPLLASTSKQEIATQVKAFTTSYYYY